MRLNKEIKSKILHNAIDKSPLITEAKKLTAERAEIAEKLRRKFITEDHEVEINQLKERLKELQKKTKIDLLSCYDTDNEIMINISGQRHNVCFSGFCSGVSNEILGIYDVAKTRVWKKVSRGTRYAVEDDCGLMKNIDECEALYNKFLDLKTQVNAILGKCNTDNQLLKIWPESAELIPAESVKQSTALMVKTDALNSMIGLPTDNEK